MSGVVASGCATFEGRSSLSVSADFITGVCARGTSDAGDLGPDGTVVVWAIARDAIGRTASQDGARPAFLVGLLGDDRPVIAVDSPSVPRAGGLQPASIEDVEAAVRSPRPVAVSVPAWDEAIPEAAASTSASASWGAPAPSRHVWHTRRRRTRSRRTRSWRTRPSCSASSRSRGWSIVYRRDHTPFVFDYRIELGTILLVTAVGLGALIIGRFQPAVLARVGAAIAGMVVLNLFVSVVARQSGRRLPVRARVLPVRRRVRRFGERGGVDQTGRHRRPQ